MAGETQPVPWAEFHPGRWYRWPLGVEWLAQWLAHIFLSVAVVKLAFAAVILFILGALFTEYRDYRNDIGAARATALIDANIAIEALDYSDRDEPRARLNSVVRLMGLNGANLSGMIIPELDLDHANFSNANLAHTVFIEALLEEAIFINSDLRGSELLDADLNGANMSNARLDGANLSGAEFQDAILAGAILDRAILFNASFSSAILSGASLVDAILVEARFSDADLTATDFTNADLSDASLSNATLIGANLNGANLTDASLLGADLKNATFSKTNLTAASFTRAENLTQQQLNNACYIEELPVNLPEGLEMPERPC